MNIVSACRNLVNKWRYAKVYKNAVAAGQFFPGFRLIDQKRDFIAEEVRPAFFLDRLHDKATLIFAYRGSYKKLTVMIDALEQEIRNYTISNMVQIEQMLATPNAPCHVDANELFRHRWDIEKTHEIFRAETMRRVEDPFRKMADRKYREDIGFADALKDREATPWSRADDIIALQNSVVSETSADVPPDVLSKKDSNVLWERMRIVVDRSLRN